MGADETGRCRRIAVAGITGAATADFHDTVDMQALVHKDRGIAVARGVDVGVAAASGPDGGAGREAGRDYNGRMACRRCRREAVAGAAGGG